MGDGKEAERGGDKHETPRYLNIGVKTSNIAVTEENIDSY